MISAFSSRLGAVPDLWAATAAGELLESSIFAWTCCAKGEMIFGAGRGAGSGWEAHAVLPSNLMQLDASKKRLEPAASLSDVATEYPGVDSMTAYLRDWSIGKEMLAIGATVWGSVGLEQSG